MDDQTLRFLIGQPEKIGRDYVERRRARGEMSDDDARSVLSLFDRPGRCRLTNVIRDVRIDMVVERLQEEGLSLRSACKRVSEVAPMVLSASAIVSIVRKERKARATDA